VPRRRCPLRVRRVPRARHHVHGHGRPAGTARQARCDGRRRRHVARPRARRHPEPAGPRGGPRAPRRVARRLAHRSRRHRDPLVARADRVRGHEAEPVPLDARDRAARRRRRVLDGPHRLLAGDQRQRRACLARYGWRPAAAPLGQLPASTTP
jgi:hypothetical protein